MTFFATWLPRCRVAPLVARAVAGALRAPCSALRLLHLNEIELDRRRPTEDADQHTQLSFVGLDLFDDAVEVLEGPVDHLDALPALEEDFRLRLRSALFHPMRDLHHLGFADRRRVVGATDEARHPRRRLDERLDEVAEVADVDQDVAGE